MCGGGASRRAARRSVCRPLGAAAPGDVPARRGAGSRPTVLAAAPPRGRAARRGTRAPWRLPRQVPPPGHACGPPPGSGNSPRGARRGCDAESKSHTKIITGVFHSIFKICPVSARGACPDSGRGSPDSGQTRPDSGLAASPTVPSGELFTCRRAGAGMATGFPGENAPPPVLYRGRTRPILPAARRRLTGHAAKRRAPRGRRRRFPSMDVRHGKIGISYRAAVFPCPSRMRPTRPSRTRSTGPSPPPGVPFHSFSERASPLVRLPSRPTSAPDRQPHISFPWTPWSFPRAPALRTCPPAS